MPSVSFEYFPPRNLEGQGVLAETVKVLSQFQPEFQSVTYGAGGSNKEGTLDTLSTLGGSSVTPVASHFTYTGSKAADISEFANELWQSGVRKLVALRGDDRGSEGPEVFKSTAQFVQTLKRYHPFEIAVSCYPEVHPLAESREKDLAVLKEKELAGASFAISQFFFDNSVFYRFVEEARDFGITLPIVPGILPIYDFAKVKKMAAECCTSIPANVEKAFGASNTSGSDAAEVACELLKAQVHDLAVAGFESIHIYTLNRSDLAGKAASTFLDAHAVIENSKRRLVA